MATAMGGGPRSAAATRRQQFADAWDRQAQRLWGEGDGARRRRASSVDGGRRRRRCARDSGRARGGARITGRRRRKWRKER